MKELVYIILGLIGVSTVALLIQTFTKKKSSTDTEKIFKSMLKSFQKWNETKDKANEELEVKKDEIKKMSNNDLADDVNAKLRKRRDNVE